MQLTHIISMAILIALTGCSSETRYKTLSFFFDGVPAEGQAGNQSGPGKGSKSTLAALDKSTVKSHGPYAAKMCEACHRKGGGQLIMPVERLCLNCHDLNIHKKHIHGPVASGGCIVCHNPHGSGKAYLLVAEPTTFCFYCHDKADVSSREVHKDAAGTQCTECHNPHASDNDYMLQ